MFASYSYNPRYGESNFQLVIDQTIECRRHDSVYEFIKAGLKVRPFLVYASVNLYSLLRLKTEAIIIDEEFEDY